MTVTALVSGGKDSIYSAYLADAQGRSVDELLTLRPSDPDSMLFHTPNLDLVPLQAEAWGKRHRAVVVASEGEAAEAHALRSALAGDRGWVVAGAIASSYQWARLHAICFELGRPLYTPLWGKDAHRVVVEEISAGLDIRFVQLAAEPLGADLLDRRLDLPMLDELERVARTVRPVHVAGEGGEFETAVVDAPFFDRRIEFRETRRESRGGAHRLVVGAAALVPRAPALRKPS
jgi:diphthine-ammonia ligase